MLRNLLFINSQFNKLQEIMKNIEFAIILNVNPTQFPLIHILIVDAHPIAIN